jgi:surface carbohydrate biosynthesis protein (TIGR04326 family)
VWDSSAAPSRQAGLVYRWNGYVEKDSIHSLFRYVETHGERLRRKYLAWVHDLGESRIDGKRLIDHLAFDDGLSYWWMTSFVEQSPWKSPSIVDAIRLLALEEIVAQQRPGTLRLVSANRHLAEVLGGLCRNLGITYEWARLPVTAPRRLTVRGMYRTLPYSARALIHLVLDLRGHWKFRHAPKSGWFDGEQAVFVCSYFGNIDLAAADEGRFHSHYWGDLHALLDRIGRRSNWLQLFVPSDAIPTPARAMSVAQRFNLRPERQECHTFLHRYLSWRMVLRVLRRWLRLNLTSARLRGIEHLFKPQGSQLSLWPLMREDWLTSMCGPVAIENLLWIELFEEALRDLPNQKKGLYLCENQAWERALVHAWRRHGHGQLIAAAHSTIAFWNLSYFTDPRTRQSSVRFPIPQADLIALNGRAAAEAYRAVDRNETIVECEALRYSYLNGLQAGRQKEAGGGTRNMLILGGLIPSSTSSMLRVLNAAVSHLTTPITCTIKPHPYCTVKAAEYPSLHLTVVNDPLVKLLPDYDIAFSSHSTSAALDAYLAGLPVIVMLDETELNLSPLRGQPGVRFVSTPEEVIEAIQTADDDMVGSPKRNDFFFLEPELPRWAGLLAT